MTLHRTILVTQHPYSALHDLRRRCDRQIVINAITQHNFNHKAAANALGITREGFYKIRKRLDLTGIKDTDACPKT